MEKKTTKVLLEIAILLIAILTTFLITFSVISKNAGYSLKEELKVDPTKEIVKYENPYSFFLPNDYAQFIIKKAESFGVDPDLAVAILHTENPNLKDYAVSDMNENGTVDVGLWQLNDKSLYDENGFVDSYWVSDCKQKKDEFNAHNWKHSTLIAIKYIADCQKGVGKKSIFNIAAAYNCGIGRTSKWILDSKNNPLPKSTLEKYAPSVVTYYNTLKSKK